MSIAEVVATPIVTPMYKNDVSEFVSMEKENVSSNESKDAEVIKSTEKNSDNTSSSVLEVETIPNDDSNINKVSDEKDPVVSGTKTNEDDIVDSGTKTNENDIVDSGTKTNENHIVDSGIKTNENDIVDSGTKTNENDIVDSGTKTNENDIVDNGTKTNENDVVDSGTKTNENDVVDSGTKTNKNGIVDNTTETNENEVDDSKINNTEGNGDKNKFEGKYELAIKDNKSIDKELDLSGSEMNMNTNINELGEDKSNSILSKFNEADMEKLFKNDEHTAASPNLEESFNEVPLMENIKEENKEMVNCYDARYSQDHKKMLVIKEDGVYVKDIKTNNEEKVINSQNEILEKANFTSDNCIIYSKAEKNDSDEYKHTIYEYNIVDSTNNKIEDGKNPVISKDGNKLAYEFGGKIRIKNLKTEVIDIIDDGQYPSWSPDGKFLSYVKIQSEKESFDETTEQKNVYVEKKYSKVWLYDVEENKYYAITNKEFVADNEKLKQWADKVINGSVCENFDLNGKYTYYESMWADNNKELYVIRRDNEREIYELVKFNLKS
jgi:hypothetical protein